MKLKVNNQKFSLVQVAGDNKVILVGAIADRAYKDGKVTDEVVGTKNQVVCLAAKYAAFYVKVPGLQKITVEEIEAATAPIEVSLPGFVGRFYRLDGASDYDFTAPPRCIVIGAPQGEGERGKVVGRGLF